ncbi:MAG: UDP-N-acetylglucosamine--N-acetylmuramyl-(pentapeptide) pyrophosphoryl-undecaprenol N-acetylglucosamine transferase [Candidatus Gracilibacteria bacterium]|nr:UDP-N-acetylglucosamine--N-acetylmuramyl-(pentapeptide) pyrophosphoryl-undecaprenol N-acetylglucosamine transferase [Candidatus Gracilibacteria bacterium]
MKKVFLVGGGTGGHIIPLLALYNYLKNDDYSFFWIGENDSMEQKIAKDNNIEFHSIKSGKLRRYFSFKTFVEPFNIMIGIFQSIKILKSLKPDMIFSKGGYVSLPMAIAGKMTGIKVYMHESDSVPGLSNRIVGKFATKIFLGFDSAKKYFNSDKCQVVGQILNPELFKDLGDVKITEKTNLLVIAGSQGSTRIFNFLLENMKKIERFNLTIVLGSLNTSFKEQFDRFDNVKAYEFVDHSVMKNLYNNADLAITRAGATNIAELEAFNIKMIIIPLKESANNHQYFNALDYEKKGNIFLTEENMVQYGMKKIMEFDGYKKNNKSPLNNTGINLILKELEK